MRAMPARISGTDSSMPMVRPPHRNPSCGSGSRKNSQIDARDAVAERERADDDAGPLQRAGADQQPQHDQQDQAFEGGLVELARMARQRARARKHHGPGHVGRPAPQLGVDEVGKAPEEQPDRRDRAGEVAERQDRDAAAPREQDDRDHAAEEAAVEGHAALPDLDDLGRVRGEVRRVVEQHVADAAAEDDAERHPDDEVVEVDDGHRRRPAPVALVADQGAGVEPAEQDAENIGERVPADRERADRDQHRIDDGKWQDK